MRATILYGAGDVRVQDLPDPATRKPTDAVVRVPQADGTLVKAAVAADSALLPSLRALTDVFRTGHHAAAGAHVRAGTTVAVVGDGAVGRCAVLAAKRLSAERLAAKRLSG